MEFDSELYREFVSNRVNKKEAENEFWEWSNFNLKLPNLKNRNKNSLRTSKLEVLPTANSRDKPRHGELEVPDGNSKVGTRECSAADRANHLHD